MSMWRKSSLNDKKLGYFIPDPWNRSCCFVDHISASWNWYTIMVAIQAFEG